VIGKSVSKPVLALLLFISGSWAASLPLALPALAAPSNSQLAEAITAAKVLPASVRVNATYYMGQVSVYMYRSGRVPDNDLKIDSVLVTKALKDKFGADVKSVQLNFYDSQNQRTVRQCTVSQAHIDGFASRKISQEELLSYLTITTTTAGGGSGSGGGSIDASLAALTAATCAPGYKEEERGIMLLQIKGIAKKGGNYQKLFTMFKQMDNMIKSGKTEEIVPVFNDINPLITVEMANCNQRAAAADSENALKAREAQVKTMMMSYYPRYGFAFQRRVAIWNAIKALSASGRDVTYQASYLFEHVDNPFYAGKLEEAKAGIVQLEKLLGIPVTYNW